MVECWVSSLAYGRDQRGSYKNAGHHSTDSHALHELLLSGRIMTPFGRSEQASSGSLLMGVLVSGECGQGLWEE